MAEPGAFDVMDRESCKRKQKADELIGYTDIYNASFVGCDNQDCATGQISTPTRVSAPTTAGAVRGSGSASDAGADGSSALEAHRFVGSADRLQAEAAARKAALRRAQGSTGSGSGSKSSGK